MNIQQVRTEYLDHMGSDLTVVNAARASFGKESTWEDAEKRTLKPADAGLIRYLATGYRTSEWEEFLKEIKETVQALNIDHDMTACDVKLTDLLHAYKRRAQHWAPFAHPQISIRVQMPIFLARQFVKHQVGGVWSEESRRYISGEPGVWFPAEWHTRPDDVKQGSGDVHENSEMWGQAAREHTKNALAFYGQAVGSGIAPEEARIVLPLNTMTTVVWTGSLLFWSRVCNQRVDSHAQLPAQELGRQIADIVRPLYPVSWKELCG